MADNQDQAQKTEEPTQKKLDDARKKGQGISSREINNFFILLGAAILVIALAPGVMGGIARSLVAFLERPHTMAVAEADVQSGFATVLGAILSELALVFGLFIVAALCAGFLQRGFNISTAQLKPEFSKISPLAGVKRIASLRSIVEFIKGIAKMIIVGAAGAMVVMPELDHIGDAISMSVLQILAVIQNLVSRMLIAVVAIMAVIAGLDYMYQRFEFRKKMRMSRQDIKDEHKQSDGDPLVKGRIRQLRQERARRRMIAAVPEADVVVTNPTHFAVALKYSGETMAAPKLVAKGVDELAQRIREVAQANDVPIVENPPLARALFSSVDLDEEVPVEHYQAVAEVIGYVWRLKGKMGQNARAGL